MKQLIAGSRGSKLAMVQTQFIADSLDCDVQIKKISTRGDKIHDVALAKIEGKGFFTKEIDDALINNEIDFAVHSYKDIPTDLPDGIMIACIPKRESPKDALVSKFKTLDELPKNSEVGTSSLRRKSEILKLRSDVIVKELRGNLDTRIKKLNDGKYDAIIVAESGLKRLGYKDYYPLDPKIFIPAACQGALAITTRKNDDEVLSILKKLEDFKTRYSCICERQFLKTLQGGCQIPAGIYTAIDEDINIIYEIGFISSLDGNRYIKLDEFGKIDQGLNLAETLASKLLKAGGRKIIDEIRRGEL